MDHHKHTYGFDYVGTIDHTGMFSQDPELYVTPSDQIDLGGPFDGYGWGAVGHHDGIGWRWIDRHSVVFANPLRGTPFEVEAKVHTAKDMESVQSVKIRIDGRSTIT